MTTHLPDDARRPADRRRGITARGRVLAAAGVALATVVASSFALFTDSGNVVATFESGTLDLKFDNNEDGQPVAYRMEFEGGDALEPGSRVTQRLRVFNSGSVAADLALGAPVISNQSASAGAPKLEDSMVLTISDVTQGTPGPVLHQGPLGAAGTSTAALFAGLDLGANGTQATATVLEFSVHLAGNAEIGVAGQSVDVTFPFTASQQ